MTDLKAKNNIEYHLNSLECFRDFTEEQLLLINQSKTKIEYYQKEVIFKQGAFASHVLFIISGLVRIYLQTGRDRQINIRLAKAGDFIAFSSLFGINIYQYSGIAVKDTTICMIEKKALNDLLIKYPVFALNITSKNAMVERRYIELIQNISYKQMRGKLASALLYLSSEEFSNDNVLSFLTRQEIADFASIGIESAIKLIKEFEKEDILNLDKRSITITNREALEWIAKTG